MGSIWSSKRAECNYILKKLIYSETYFAVDCLLQAITTSSPVWICLNLQTWCLWWRHVTPGCPCRAPQHCKLVFKLNIWSRQLCSSQYSCWFCLQLSRTVMSCWPLVLSRSTDPHQTPETETPERRFIRSRLHCLPLSCVCVLYSFSFSSVEVSDPGLCSPAPLLTCWVSLSDLWPLCQLLSSGGDPGKQMGCRCSSCFERCWMFSSRNIPIASSTKERVELLLVCCQNNKSHNELQPPLHTLLQHSSPVLSILQLTLVKVCQQNEHKVSKVKVVVLKQRLYILPVSQSFMNDGGKQESLSFHFLDSELTLNFRSHVLFGVRPLQVTASSAKLMEWVCVEPSLVSIFSSPSFFFFARPPYGSDFSGDSPGPVLELGGLQICQTALRVSRPRRTAERDLFFHPGDHSWLNLHLRCDLHPHRQLLLHVSTRNSLNVFIQYHLQRLRFTQYHQECFCPLCFFQPRVCFREWFLVQSAVSTNRLLSALIKKSSSPPQGLVLSLGWTDLRAARVPCCYFWGLTAS